MAEARLTRKLKAKSRGQSTSSSNTRQAMMGPWRVVSPPKPSSATTDASSSGRPAASVKHMTCFFWARNGTCKWSDEDCLYAHYHTGYVANGPLQVEPGRPAVAGKNATSTRPVYADWRGTQDVSPQPRGIDQRTGIPLDVQEQIKHIAAKARARDREQSNLLPQKRRLSEAGSLEQQIAASADTAQVYGASLSHSQIEVLRQTMETLAETVYRDHYTIDKAVHTLTQDLELLAQVFPEMNEGYLSPRVQQGSHALRRLAQLIAELSYRETSIDNFRADMIRELDRAGLNYFLPSWPSPRSLDEQERNVYMSERPFDHL